MYLAVSKSLALLNAYSASCQPPNLIIAFSLLPAEIRERHHLVLVGDVGRHGEIRQMVKQREIEKQTVYTGVVSDERLASLYQQASVFVFLSCIVVGFFIHDPVLQVVQYVRFGL